MKRISRPRLGTKERGAANLFAPQAGKPGWKAGIARAVITPEPGMWMAGYAIRDTPAQGSIMDLWVKALALEDAHGNRAIILTSDVLGIPQNIYRRTCAMLKKKYGLAPHQVLLSASHTHCGPVLRDALYDIYPLGDHQRNLIEQYSVKFERQIIDTIGRALSTLAPVMLTASQGKAGFAVNRRNNMEKEVPQLINEGALKGPVDHSVPVLAVYNPDRSLKAVLFGYACHNTTLAINEWCGDYSGYAQLTLERSRPGVQAMFFMGCGGDQNPLPRRKIRLAERYGSLLASAVEETLLLPLQPLPPQLATKMEMVTLYLGAAPTEKDLRKWKDDVAPPTRRWAGRLLAEKRAGKAFIREYPYPMQVWELGGRQILVVLAGEPVVDYALKLKMEFGEGTWVLGYCNDLMNYIPSLRVLREDVPPLANPQWGYEGSYAFTVYGMPAKRWAEDVEERVMGAARRLMLATRHIRDVKYFEPPRS